jgi:hypothetical protein
MSGILTSRKFWALVIGLLLLVAVQFIPSFAVDEELAISFLVIIASYILGVAVDPGPGGWRGVLQSRKFWAALVGFAVLVLNGFGVNLPEGLPAETLIWFAVLIGTFISGVALEAPIRALLNK